MKASLADLVLGDQVVCSTSGSLSPRKLKATGPKVSLVTGAVQGIHSGAKIIQVGYQNDSKREPNIELPVTGKPPH